MGLFDFMKGKPKPAARRREAETMQAKLDDLGERLGGKPRFWHYFVAHVALRDIALRGEGLPPSAAEPGRAHGFFAMILTKMAPHLGVAETDADRLAQGFAIHHRRIGEAEAAIVELPPPEGPTECYFVAIVPSRGGQPAQFFTLEKAGGVVVLLGGWSADEEHLDFGEGPVPTVDAFVTAVADRLSRAR
jgi:hypothetical protein